MTNEKLPPANPNAAPEVRELTDAELETVAAGKDALGGFGGFGGGGGGYGRGYGGGYGGGRGYRGAFGGW